jgi:hypothetical protein
MLTAPARRSDSTAGLSERSEGQGAPLGQGVPATTEFLLTALLGPH